MRAKDLRNCDCCGGTLTGVSATPGEKPEPGKFVWPGFYKMTLEPMEVDEKTFNQNVGLAQYFQGNYGLAEIMGPPDPHIVKPSKNGKVTELLVCMDCVMKKYGELMVTIGQRVIALEKEAKKEEAKK